METQELGLLVKGIVRDAERLKDEHVRGDTSRVNYACVFSHSKEEFDALAASAGRIGKVVDQTSSGPLFRISPIETSAGKLQLLKIRMPDPSRPERGDADFTVDRFAEFKRAYLDEPGFKLIPREGFEMVELVDKRFDVRAYFSNPPLDAQLGLA